MALHPAEEATLRTFVVPAKRERLLGLLGSRKRRKQALDSLNHFAGWEPRCIQSLSSSADMVRVLRQAGSPDECHLISDDPELDGRDLPLADAVAAAETCDFATVLCCLPGEIACFFDEVAAPRIRLLLRRAGSAK